MRRNPVGLHGVHPGSFSSGFRTSRSRRLEHQTGLRIRCFLFEQRPPRKTTHLFVARKEDSDRPGRSYACPGKVTKGLEHQDDVRLHIERAAAVKPSVLDSGRVFLLRAARVNRVGVTEQQSGFFRGRVKSANDDVLAVTFRRDAFDLKIFGDFVRFRFEPDGNHPASGFVARRRFDFDELLNPPHDSLLCALKKFEKFVHLESRVASRKS